MALDQEPREVGRVQLKDAEAAELIGRIAKGDRSALNSLYDGSCRLLFGLVLRILGDQTTAEEVLLDVYTQVWKQSASFDPQRHTALVWLTAIARTLAIVRLRSEKQKPRILESLVGKLEEITTALEGRNRIRSAIESLPSEQRRVLDLAYFSGLSYPEIASQLGQPLGTIKTRAWLGMIKLGDLFRPIFEGDK